MASLGLIFINVNLLVDATTLNGLYDPHNFRIRHANFQLQIQHSAIASNALKYTRSLLKFSQVRVNYVINCSRYPSFGEAFMAPTICRLRSHLPFHSTVHVNTDLHGLFGHTQPNCLEAPKTTKKHNRQPIVAFYGADAAKLSL